MASHLDSNVIPPSRQRETPRSGLTWIGQSMKRVEDPRILAGKGGYIDDVTVPGMAHAAMVTSPHAHARIVSIDTSKARALPGVIGVYTGQDLARVVDPCPSFASPPVPQHAIVLDKVRHVGEVVAAVVAEDRYVAEDAAELVEVEWEILPANVDIEASLEATGDAVIHPDDRDSNRALDESFQFGPVDEHFAAAAHVIKRRLRWHRSSAQAIETCGVVAQFDPISGSYTIHANTNFYNFIPFVIGGSLRVSPGELRIIPVLAGGSFGSKVFNHKILIRTAGLSRLAGVPVKYIEDRVEHFTNSDSHGSDRLYDAELAVMEDGTFKSLRFTVLDDYGAYLQFGVGTHGNAMAQVTGPYRIESFGMRVIAVLSNKTQQGPYRGFGSEVTNWVMERMADAAAKELGRDPVELREQNMIAADAFPYMIPTGNIYDSGNFQKVLAEAKGLFDLDAWRERAKALRAGGRCVGVGVATCMERSVYGPTEWWSLNNRETPGFTLTSTPEAITARVDPSGKLFVTLHSPMVGNSPETVVTQVLAERLTVAPEDVVINYSDSQSGFNSVGPQGSRFTAMIAGACVSASIKLEERLKRFGAYMLQRRPEDVELRDGCVAVVGSQDQKKTFAEIALTSSFFRLSFPEGEEYDSGIDCTAVYDHPISTDPDPERKHLGIFYPIVGHICHMVAVEVDPGTGKVEILDYAAVHDNGTIVNPRTLGGQVWGGTANGIGTALSEQFLYDADGQFTNPNFSEFAMPTANEMPRNFKLGHVETPSPYTEYGVKGGGEGGRLGAPSALTSAIEDALSDFGVTISSLPVTPPVLRGMIRAAQASG
ncbi:xanthine dehydrogenase family protein molybdopterin-binding subunit [Paralimibaculum aggregatum]|uniref:Xanthine dehydrogenase family protein molybdopterin-binding subunit n=1 Tax=Paralimibaculum aggregatum TaxID=3036245 RepID=A0ABQ6LSX5_9RHOB|nr:xanthine dehydrogenase family protein molybdopterin-binding subunit [Limibaculum sp. NKW23]GMG85190.1 xanthine dehydrogenase family protein molybdopterin-binding subunit [Limibaculum sp. NKW23]